jgi:3-oxoadipate enol-lactonase
MFYKTTDNQNLYYELIGNKKSNKFLIFLNGISQSSDAWKLMIPYFEKKFQIIVCDFIFQGQSDKQAEDRDLDQHAKDMFGLINYLGIGKVNVIGISYGSLVAQHLVLNHPERVDKLVLLSTFAHKTAYYNAIEMAWERTLDSGGYALMFDVMLPMVLGESYFENPLISIETLRSLRQSMNQSPEALKKLGRAIRERSDYREKLKAIKKPTLIIHGEKDFLLQVHMGKAVADAIEGSRFEIIEEVGHTLNLEAVPQVIKYITEFF